MGFFCFSMKSKEILFSSKTLLFIGIVIFIIIYYKVPFIFFQQDEWYAFGNIIDLGSKLIFYRFNVGDINHFVPLNSFIGVTLYKIFGLNYIGYNAVDLFLHFINGLLVFVITLKINKKKSIALLSAILFISSASAAQLVMWPFVGVNMLTLTFALLAWFVALGYPTGRRLYFKGLVVALLTIMALMTNEYAGGLLIFVPALTIIFAKKGRIHDAFRFLLPFSVLGLSYIFIRFNVLGGGGVFSGESILSKLFLLKIIEFPLLYFGQSLLFGETFTVFAEEIILRSISLIIGLFVIAASFVTTIVLKKKYPNYAKNLLLVLIFILVSSLPFVLIPGEAGKFVIFAPRYLYFGIAGIAILISLLADISFLLTKKKLGKIISLFIVMFILFGVFGNWKRSNDLFQAGKQREGILNKIKESYPHLPDKTVFYTQSDISYFGLPEDYKILPFQSGFGQTLLVWYQATEYFPTEFFQDRFLWEITDQGYREIKSRGFGYFRNFELLAETIKKEGIPIDSTIAFRYDLSKQKVEDISVEVRGRLDGYAAKKKEIVMSRVGLNSSLNSKDTNFLRDNNRETFWDSKLPYIYPQFIEIDLNMEEKIAQIQIDSYHNKDQNEVGYRVSLFGDDGIWHEVFYAKRYPPDEDGIVNLYFEPQVTRRVKIEQVGGHSFASWVIHELKIYEAIN